jgi:phage antirepressor YoqD-like protein
MDDLLKRAMDTIQELQEALTKSQTEIEEQKKINKTMDRAFGSDSLIDMKEVAKVLNIKGYGRNTIFGILRDMKILMKKNEPYQSYVDRGYFKLIEVMKTDQYGRTWVFWKPMITQKGLHFIKEKIDEILS